MDGESPLDKKLSTLSLEEELSPGSGAVLAGEESDNCEPRGAMSCAKTLSLCEGQDSKAAGEGLSSSGINGQKIQEDEVAPCMESIDGPPDGFFLIFPYVDLKALLTLERVSKPVRSGVNDVLVWRKLHVQRPLSRILSNDILLSLVERAKGNLTYLRLVECFRITDATLGDVLSLSPHLEKLHIPGCIRLSPEAIVYYVEQHAKENRAKRLSGIKQLRVQGIYMTQQHLNALRAIVMSEREDQAVHAKPLYWHIEPTSVVEDERAIDVEMCPRCASDYPVVVYDCTKVSCQRRGRLDPSKACRGCVICITRCVACGSCGPEEDWEKTCCSDVVCLTCWLHVPKCAECNRPFCRRHKAEFYVRSQDGPRICEDCMLSSSDSEDFSNQFLPDTAFYRYYA